MKTSKLCRFTNLVLIAVILALVYVFIFSGEAIEGEDNRQAIVLGPAEKHYVLEEMRLFLANTQGIADAISRDDMRTVAELARTSGMATTLDTPHSVMQALPADFKQMGMGVHRAFDQIALDAEQLGDPQHSLKQLADTLSRCVACHASYQLTTQGAD